MSESITIEELMAELAAVRETLEAERRESFGQWQRDDRIIHELRGQVERLRQKTEAVELVPAPKGMCSSFYEFIGAGAPRSESGEVLIVKPINPAEAAFRGMMADDFNRSEMEKLGLSERQLLFVYAMGWVAGRHDGTREAQADGS